MSASISLHLTAEDAENAKGLPENAPRPPRLATIDPIDNRPIRVVLFGSGPVLTHDARQFICRLEAEPEIEFAAAFCQAEGQSWTAVARDFWRRRGWLAVPLLAAWVLNEVGRTLRHPCRERALARELTRLSERIHFITNIHAPEVIAQISALDPDLGLIYGSPILKPAVFETPTRGTLGIHHGKVPQYRGNKTAFWAMYNGEAAAGVTIQKVNAGLDTGQIVKAGEVVIGKRSQRAVWQELEQLGLDLYMQAILEVKAGTATYKPQCGPKGKLYKNPKFGDLVEFWRRQWRRRLRG
ncbi:MAG: formyltransferase family protein [Chloroflexota bacterium]